MNKERFYNQLRKLLSNFDNYKAQNIIEVQYNVNGVYYPVKIYEGITANESFTIILN